MCRYLVFIPFNESNISLQTSVYASLTYIMSSLILYIYIYKYICARARVCACVRVCVRVCGISIVCLDVFLFSLFLRLSSCQLHTYMHVLYLICTSITRLAMRTTRLAYSLWCYAYFIEIFFRFEEMLVLTAWLNVPLRIFSSFKTWPSFSITSLFPTSFHFQQFGNSTFWHGFRNFLYIPQSLQFFLLNILTGLEVL
jgi:hypothetical protein